MDIPADIRRDVKDRLILIECEHDVHILHAIESGSRGWGFPSPDSDYDVRFIYVHPRDRYLSLRPPRDVIELPVDGAFDINGWDLKKALRLLLKGNAVVLEWVNSPITYYTSSLDQEMIKLANAHVSRRAIASHYWHFARRQLQRHKDQQQRPRKKQFYTLRPALALRYLRLHPDSPVAPMDIHSLIENNIHDDLREVIVRMLAEKEASNEMGVAPLHPVIADFVQQEMNLALIMIEGMDGATISDEAYEMADAIFKGWIAELGDLIEREARWGL